MPRSTNGTGSDPRISQKLRAAIANLIEGRARTQGEAAKLANFSGPQFSRALRKPHVQRYLLEQSTKHLRGVPAALAAARLSNLLHAKSEDVSARVAASIARSAGILSPDGPVAGDAAFAPGPVLIVNFRHLPNPPDQIAAASPPQIEVQAAARRED